MAPPDTEPTSGQSQDERCFSVVFPYGFIDEAGMHRFWHAGQQVRDPDELALLQARDVNLKED